MRALYESSEPLASQFKHSDIGAVAKEIIQGSTDHYGRLIADSTRSVFSLGNIGTEEDPAYAVLKVHPDRYLQQDFFEVDFLYQIGEIADIESPKFAFACSVGWKSGVVMEDVSENEKYRVTDAIEVLLGRKTFTNAEDFERANMHYQNQFLKAPSVADRGIEVVEMFAAKSYRNTVVAGTSLVVYDEEEFKRMVCADADQLYNSLGTGSLDAEIAHCNMD